ncbi:PD-(D/E)XK motif protein [Mesoflavibacter sp. SCSIO 43206]|uniref:PD-(D/E)XK motif protein n=1 Tax=Mesoflavibacter sp. SCSIO 43206 TaxID=2779362 RepID=UPI001CA8B275|nr:PD-(D/E)XK motif protein [Mesoflavibacter sp. SCSIO 43206]UAB74331.1 PD-(D/E)XK motif protein [Mesoflavibacter sp. SCSIO 43206]
MIENYISKLSFTSLKDEKIKALEVPLNDLKCYLYYDYSKQLHLIIKSEESINENRKGIKVKNTTLDLIDYGKDKFIDIVCTHEDFKKEFIQIIEQIIENFKENNDITRAVKFTINKWYYFFEKEMNVELTESEIKGLIGELLLIKNLSQKINYKEIIKAWKGPESSLRDFNFKTFDIEVKTSSKEIGHIHKINGQIQLKSEDIPLYIYSVSLKKSDSSNAITVKKLIDFICMEIGNDSFLLNEFFEKLEKINVLVPETEKYNRFSYEVNNILTIKIDNKNVDQFLVKNENTRISNLIYDYDFNGLTNNEII